MAITRFECKHKNWVVLGSDLPGSGTCLDCKKLVSLPELFNNLKIRMETVVKKAEDILNKQQE